MPTTFLCSRRHKRQTKVNHALFTVLFSQSLPNDFLAQSSLCRHIHDACIVTRQAKQNKPPHFSRPSNHTNVERLLKHALHILTFLTQALSHIQHIMRPSTLLTLSSLSLSLPALGSAQASNPSTSFSTLTTTSTLTQPASTITIQIKLAHPTDVVAAAAAAAGDATLSSSNATVVSVTGTGAVATGTGTGMGGVVAPGGWNATSSYTMGSPGPMTGATTMHGAATRVGLGSGSVMLAMVVGVVVVVGFVV